jgi:hypothetical protein
MCWTYSSEDVHLTVSSLSFFFSIFMYMLLVSVYEYMSFNLWDGFKPCASATRDSGLFPCATENREIPHTWTNLNVAS